MRMMDRAMASGFQVGQHNAHYEGVYSAKEREWRRICAIDKAAHIADLLGESGSRVESVLEVGCGTGAVLARLSSIGVGRQFTGIDVVDPTTNLESNGAAVSDFRWSAYDGTTVPYADGTFDLVYASHVLEHVPEPRAFLRELARVSRQFVFVEVPCELHGRTNHDALQSTLDIGHINFYTPDTFVLTLQTSGLTPSKVAAYDHSLAVHEFHTSRLRGLAKSGVRKALLAASPRLATRIATYHCGALCAIPGRDIRGSDVA
jgi:SAM-dependent methyltransferase